MKRTGFADPAHSRRSLPHDHRQRKRGRLAYGLKWRAAGHAPNRDYSPPPFGAKIVSLQDVEERLWRFTKSYLGRAGANAPV